MALLRPAHGGNPARGDRTRDGETTERHVPRGAGVRGDRSQLRPAGTLSSGAPAAVTKLACAMAHSGAGVVSVAVSGPSQGRRLLAPNSQTPQGQPGTPVDPCDHPTLGRSS